MNDQLERLLERSKNSPGNIAPISPATVQLTESILRSLETQIKDHGILWTSPHITTEGDGDVMLEWIKNSKRLSIHILHGKDIEYLKIWGPRIQHDMKSGTTSKSEIYILWAWFCE